MITKQTFYGGSTIWNNPFASVFIRDRLPARLHVFTNKAQNTTLKLREATDVSLRLGGPTFYIINEGNYTLTVEDYDANTLFTLLPDEAAILFLVENSSTAGKWGWRISSIV